MRLALPTFAARLLPTPASAICLSACLSAVLSVCQAAPLRPFTTDGCSMFPDRAPIGQADWCSCCVAHDLAYWRGGTQAERLEADRELERCVTEKAHNPELAKAMFAGVRVGGEPYYLTSYRWGYGWDYGRGYRPLSADEQAQAASLRATFLAANPTLACTRDSGDHHAGRD